MSHPRNFVDIGINVCTTSTSYMYLPSLKSPSRLYFILKHLVVRWLPLSPGFQTALEWSRLVSRPLGAPGTESTPAEPLVASGRAFHGVCVCVCVLWKSDSWFVYTYNTHYGICRCGCRPHLRSHCVVEAGNDRVQKGHVHLVAKVQQTHGLLCSKGSHRRHPVEMGGREGFKREMTNTLALLAPHVQIHTHTRARHVIAESAKLVKGHPGLENCKVTSRL